jgi:hypothetical protein
MNDRQKLAALLLRIIGAGWSALIVLGFTMWFVEKVLGVPVREYRMHTLLGNAVYIIGGILLALFAKPLGRLFGRGLD